MRRTTIVLFAAALLAVPPAVLAQGVPGKTPGLQHKVSKKHYGSVYGFAPPHAMQNRRSNYPRAFGYAPGSGDVDRELEMSRLAGGGGGGGGGGM